MWVKHFNGASDEDIQAHVLISLRLIHFWKTTLLKKKPRGTWVKFCRAVQNQAEWTVYTTSQSVTQICSNKLSVGWISILKKEFTKRFTNEAITLILINGSDCIQLIFSGLIRYGRLRDLDNDQPTFSVLSHNPPNSEGPPLRVYFSNPIGSLRPTANQLVVGSALIDCDGDKSFSPVGRPLGHFEMVINLT